MIKENDNSKIKRYLLGQPTDDPEQIEKRLMTDDDFFEKFLAAEEELIQSYSDDDLTGIEKSWFETHFLISAERHQKLNFARALRTNLDKQTAPDSIRPDPVLHPPPHIDSDNFLIRLVSRYLSNPVPVLATIIIAAVLTGTVFYFYQETAPLSPLETEFARLNREDFSQPAEYSKFSGLSLLSGITRSGADNPDKLSENLLTEKVFLRLALPPPATANSGETFQIEISLFKKIVFTQTEIRPYQNPNGRELRFLIPASVLGKGEHQLTAKGTQSGEFSYLFSVE